MKNFTLGAFFLMASFGTAKAQADLNCGDGRYVSDKFTVTKTTGIPYGVNSTRDYTTNTTYSQTLNFDFYAPAADPAVKRPLIILAFGGGFVNGVRADLDPLCTALAKKGYAVATIDYRLIYPSYFNILTVYTTPALIQDAVVKASGDLKAAIRFFKRDAATSKTYKIDSTKIFVGGYSAGAILALQTAYVDPFEIAANASFLATYTANGGFEGNTDLASPNNLLPTYTSTGIAGVLNISGGIYDTLLVSSNNPPIYSVHGNADETVPYDYGYAVDPLAQINLYGSNAIRKRANNVGIQSQLLTIAGGNHASPTISPNFENLVAGASAFFQPIVCNITVPIQFASFNARLNNCNPVLEWQTATELNTAYFEIEASTNGRFFEKIGSVVATNRATGSAYNYTYASFSGTRYFRIKTVDKDGAFQYSPTTLLSANCLPLSVRVLADAKLNNINIAGLTGNNIISVYDIAGRELRRVRTSSTVENIDGSAFAAGIYVLKITDTEGNLVQSLKLLKP